jgi:hypothetical protein
MNVERRFAAWCVGRSRGRLGDVQPFHVAAFVTALSGRRLRAL